VRTFAFLQFSAALAETAFEGNFELREFFDFLVNRRQLAFKDFLNVNARGDFFGVKRQQLFDLFKRKPLLLSSEEFQAFEIGISEQPESPLASLVRVQKPSLFVKSIGVDADTRFLRCRTDLHFLNTSRSQDRLWSRVKKMSAGDFVASASCGEAVARAAQSRINRDFPIASA
jgi:hypothetical protein